MNHYLDLLGFAGMMLLAQFSPGPDMLLLTRTSLSEGAKSGVLMSLGIATGLAVHATLALGGLVLIIQQNELLRLGIKWFAVCYLGWIAWSLITHSIRELKSRDEKKSVPNKALRSSYIRGLLCNLFK